MNAPRDWPYGPPDHFPQPVDEAPARRVWVVWGLVMLLLVLMLLAAIGLSEATKPNNPAVTCCADVC